MARSINSRYSETELFAVHCVQYILEFHGHTLYDIKRQYDDPSVRNHFTEEVKISLKYFLSFLSPIIHKSFKRLENDKLVKTSTFLKYVLGITDLGFRADSTGTCFLMTCTVLGSMAAYFFGAGVSTAPLTVEFYVESFIRDENNGGWMKLQQSASHYAKCWRETSTKVEVRSETDKEKSGETDVPEVNNRPLG